MTDTADVVVGDELPPFTRVTGLANWNRYAAVNDEFVPIHMDDEAGKAAGYPTAFGMGNLQWSYLHNVIREWGGADVRILKIACQFRAPNVKGQEVTAHGTVTAVRQDGDRRVVELNLRTQTQDGTILAPGTATVSLPIRDPG
jgi:acyl dehydratase